jgi:serine O-acetyltransferase
MSSSLFGDLWRYVPRGGESKGLVKAGRYFATMLLHPGWHAMFHLRLAQVFRRMKLYPLSWFLYRLNMFLFRIDIPPEVSIGRGAWLPHPIGIVIARDATIGQCATIYQNVTIGGRHNPPVLGNSVIVGAGAVVLGPVTLGDGVCVGANAVVTKSFPSGVTVVGVPAEVLQKADPTRDE